MARSTAAAIENNFLKGLITEFGALNAVENSCSETYNCVFELTGVVSRRLGIDFEQPTLYKTINRTESVVVPYLWKNVTNDGTVNLLVMQIGEIIYFWDVSSGGVSVSNGAISDTVTLMDFDASGSPSPGTKECQFADGNGILFVAHPTCEPFYITYDATTQTATGTQITPQIRDFDGLTDAVAADTRLASISDAHRYNLANQGWTSYVAANISTTNNTPGTGAKTWTIATGLTNWAAGDPVYAIDYVLDPANTVVVQNSMVGTVTSYTSGTGALVCDIKSANNSSAKSTWYIGHQPPYIEIFFAQMGFYPSNADVWWAFKDGHEIFSPGRVDLQVPRVNRRAPQGHFLLNPYNKDRSTASTISGISTVTTSYQRAQSVAFFAGRVWYGGVNYAGSGGFVFFSQIAKNNDQYSKWYQANDPTSEDTFDLLPDDGGVVSIPEAGTIIKLYAVPGALLVFATNGVWSISGSTGIGFSALDYSVNKISPVVAASATGFVDAHGTPYFWGVDDIYRVTPNQTGQLAVEAVTRNSIHSFYDDIPSDSKQNAHGYFDRESAQIHWVYRSETAGTLTERYEFDRILTMDTQSGAFSPWTIANGGDGAHINGIVVLDTSGAAVETLTIIDNALDTVIDDAGDTVIAYAFGQSISTPRFKYIATTTNGASYDFGFAEARDTTYVDWLSTDDVGVDFTSYFVCAPKVHGEAQRNFQANYLYVFLDNNAANSVDVNGIWNYATGATGPKITRTQRLTTTGTDYSVSHRRIKMPGWGLGLQYMFTSVTGQPFLIHGWSARESGNQMP